MNFTKKLAGPILAAALAVAMPLNGCAAWDNPMQMETRQLVDSLEAAGDPHQTQGVAMVTGISEVEPVDAPRQNALPVELTDADGYDVTVTDVSPGARPGLNQDMAAEFVKTVGQEPKPKLGWTDVARFSELGIPAVNYGPGDPLYAHRADEQVPVSDIITAVEKLHAFLEADS